MFLSASVASLILVATTKTRFVYPVGIVRETSIVPEEGSSVAEPKAIIPLAYKFPPDQSSTLSVVVFTISPGDPIFGAEALIPVTLLTPF